MAFSPRLATAAPASDWITLTSGTAVNLWSVASSVDTAPTPPAWVAVGEQGVIVTSSDEGATWTRQASGTTAWLTSVAYSSAAHRFFAAGEGGVILSSPDGVSWSREVSPTSIRLNAVTTNGAIQAVGEPGAGLLTRGLDGVWTQTPLETGARWLRGATGNILVGQGGVILSTASPTTATEWISLPSPTSADLEAATFGPVSGGISFSVVAVGAGGTILQKTDAGFVVRNSGTTQRLNAICSKAGGSTVIITNTLRPVFSEYFVVGAGGTILRSADGANWQADHSPTSQNLRAVCNASSAVVAVGDGGTILKIGGAGLAPTITRQPTMAYDAAGQSYLDGDATGSGVLTYMWVQLAGAPFPVGFDHPRQSLAKPLYAVGSAATAVYQLLVGNAFGLVRSETVSPNRFRNLSSRAVVNSGEGALICGFALAGLQPSLPRTVLVRAVGPALANFGVSNSLRAPKLTVFSGSQPIASNLGWRNQADPAALATAALQVGAFALSPTSDDSALLLSLAPGNYTAQVESADGSVGVALAEVYDLGAPTPTRLANLSARARVQSGERVLIGGLFIDGGLRKKVLLRAAGPALTAFGVTGILAKPKLTLFRGDAVIATATAWSTAENPPALAAAAKAVGAFAFSEGSADAALYLELEPGTYTVMISGADGGSGVGLVEAYETP